MTDKDFAKTCKKVRTTLLKHLGRAGSEIDALARELGDAELLHDITQDQLKDIASEW